jgi:hypothetical protein
MIIYLPPEVYESPFLGSLLIGRCLGEIHVLTTPWMGEGGQDSKDYHQEPMKFASTVANRAPATAIAIAT